MTTRKQAGGKGKGTGGRRAEPAATSNWFTDAMSDANMGIVRAHERKARKPRKK